MTSLRVAIALLRIPRLFASLFLFPVLISLVLVYVQLVITHVVLSTITSVKDRDSFEETYQRSKTSNPARLLVFGANRNVAAITLCRWVTGPAGNEVPPGRDCLPDRLDVAVLVKEPAKFDAAPYLKLFDGASERLHICRNCRPDIVIDLKNGGPEAHAKSLPGLLVLSLLGYSDEAHVHYARAMEVYERMETLIGPILFYSDGLRRPIKINELEFSVAAVFNIAALVVVALWLALRAHRKVLDYFSKNGALLPMVAATGKHAFYGSIWFLTIFRTAAFLVAAVPLMVSALHNFSQTFGGQNRLGMDRGEVALWLIAIVFSLSFATLLASVADLKQRHQFFSFVYRYVPLLLCGLGLSLWSLSFIFDEPIMAHFRSGLASMPLLGIGPMLLAPIFEPQSGVIVIHTLLTSACMVWLLKQNAGWFAAHLEDL